MKERAVVYALIAILLVSLAGVANAENIAHKIFMKGQVLDVTNGTAFLCIGSAAGAKVGQELPVYRYVKLAASGVKGVPSFTRNPVGSLKITEIVDVHMARAKILSGDVKEHDMAELEE